MTPARHSAATGSPASETLLTAALAAAGRGWRVFPLRPGDKRPAVRDWEARATTDAGRIRRCWSTGPYNIGIACGPSGLVVVDLDTPKNADDRPPEQWAQPGVTCGADVLAVLAERHGQRLPLDTYTVRTGRGGLHLYFTAPPGARLRNSAGRLGWLVDTRAAGGYVVAAGSTVAGRCYTVGNDAGTALLPDWLADLLTEPETEPRPRYPHATPTLTVLAGLGPRRAGYAYAALRGEVERVVNAVPGTRNHTLNQAAFALGQLVGAGLLPRDLAEQALAIAGQAAGLPARECAATIRSGLDAGQREPRGGAA